MKNTKENKSFWDEYKKDIGDIGNILENDYDRLKGNFYLSVSQFVIDKRIELEKYLIDNGLEYGNTFFNEFCEMESKIPNESKLLFWRYFVLCYFELSRLPNIDFEILMNSFKVLWEKYLREIDDKFSEIFTEEGLSEISCILDRQLNLNKEEFKRVIYLSFKEDLFYGDSFHYLSENFIYIDKKDKKIHIFEQIRGFKDTTTFIRPGTHAISTLNFSDFMRYLLEESGVSVESFDCAMNIFKIIASIDINQELDKEQLKLLALSIYDSCSFKEYTLRFFQKLAQRNLLENNIEDLWFQFGRIPVYDEIAEKYLKDKTIEFAF